MKRKLIAPVIGTALMVGMIATGCESGKRSLKNIESGMSGLDRTVEVYTHTGEKIREYEGKIDVAGEDSNSTKFDLNGKRVIIKDAIVIIEEK